jgi:CheY-like chemotaxis protein
MLNFGAQRDLPTVLLIDDDPISREVAATVLTMSGYTVHTAESGAAALESLATGTYDPGVILMDAQMPGLGGTQLIEQLRACSRARLYAISGSRPPAEILAAADGFLLKPFTPEDLRKLEKRQPQAATSPAKDMDLTAPVVDPETLARLREMMPEAAVGQIYAAIVADLARRIAALEAAIADKNVAEIRRIGHAIKGGCGMAGALQAARLGAALESPVNHLDNSPALLENLRSAAASLKRMLEVEFPA